MSSTLWQEARIHHQPYRARFSLCVGDSAPGSAVEAVGMGHIAPDGSEVWLFSAVIPSACCKALTPAEANLQVILNALPTRAWYARASGALGSSTGLRRITWAFHQITRFGMLQISKHDGTPIWPSCIQRTSPPRAEIGQNKFKRDAPRYQFRILGADGKYRWFVTQAEPLRDSDGQISYWVGVNIDIDDKKRASEALDDARSGSVVLHSPQQLPNSLRLSLQDCATIGACRPQRASSSQLAFL